MGRFAGTHRHRLRRHAEAKGGSFDNIGPVMQPMNLEFPAVPRPGADLPLGLCSFPLVTLFGMHVDIRAANGSVMPPLVDYLTRDTAGMGLLFHDILLVDVV